MCLFRGARRHAVLAAIDDEQMPLRDLLGVAPARAPVPGGAIAAMGYLVDGRSNVLHLPVRGAGDGGV